MTSGGGTRLEEIPPAPQKKKGLFSRWAFWMTVAIALFGGVSGFSLALLYKLPALPNCPSIFWPTASASLRVYCAELAANKKTVDDLLTAIRLVDGLPDDHPMRDEADQMIDQWSLDILDLAEATFNDGDLEQAIEMAEKVPTQGRAYEQVKDRIEGWRSTWAKAERIYQEAESALQADDLRRAFSIAVQLLNVGNTYWATTKYDELNQLIDRSREDSAALAEARSLSKRGGLSNVLQAIEQVEAIKEDSYLYPAARRLLVQLWDDVLDLGKDALDRGDVDDVMSIADRLPPGLEYQAQASDLRELAIAVRQARDGTIPGLESAIIQAQGLPESRPLYVKAQQLANRWQREVEDLQRIALARRMAAPGTVEALREAIAEVERVPRSNPRSDEAKELAESWLRDVQTIEDRPYLERAEQLASQGDVLSLQSAILEARRIGSGRPLHTEASQRIREWTRRVERIQDQPLLNEAERLAQQGDLRGAIAAAQRIQSERALHDEAQARVERWQGQIDRTIQTQAGESRIRQAMSTATLGTPTALASAIQIANQVESSNPNRSEADRMINQWSESLLRMAQEQAPVDLERAIAIAELVPPQTTAFAPAQLQLQDWRSRLSSAEGRQPTRN